MFSQQFCYTLGILFLIQVILAILAFVFSAEVKAKVIELLEIEGILRYQGNDPDLTNFIDWFQETVSCDSSDSPDLRFFDIIEFCRRAQ